MSGKGFFPAFFFVRAALPASDLRADAKGEITSGIC